MASAIFRNHATNQVQNAIRDAKAAGAIDHAGMRGRVREIAAGKLISPFLSSEFRVVTGKIIDSYNQLSSESDLIIYSPRLLAPILFSERDGIFPVDACFYSIEVKSRLTSNEVADAVVKSRRLRTLRYTSGQFAQNGSELPAEVFRVVPVLFGFESDLSAGGKSELARYAEHDPGWKNDPLIAAICVAGVGYWFYVARFQRWGMWRANPECDEIIHFISGIANTLPEFLASRGDPRLGKYMVEESGLEWA